jgi:hypothetical protein
MNAGRLAVCTRFLEGAFDVPAEMLAKGRRHNALALASGLLLAADAFAMQGDRTPENPNVLYWRDRLVPIDHGDAFSPVRDGYSARQCAQARLHPRELANHPFFHHLRRIRNVSGLTEGVARVASMSDADIRSVAWSWPDELDCPKKGLPPLRERMETFLRARKATVEEIVSSLGLG